MRAAFNNQQSAALGPRMRGCSLCASQKHTENASSPAALHFDLDPSPGTTLDNSVRRMSCNAQAQQLSNGPRCFAFFLLLCSLQRTRWCCGDMNHFDISVFAFEKLAELKWGVIPIEYRRVACDAKPEKKAGWTSTPLPGEFPPLWAFDWRPTDFYFK